MVVTDPATGSGASTAKLTWEVPLVPRGHKGDGDEKDEGGVYLIEREGIPLCTFPVRLGGIRRVNYVGLDRMGDEGVQG